MSTALWIVGRSAGTAMDEPALGATPRPGGEVLPAAAIVGADWLEHATGDSAATTATREMSRRRTLGRLLTPR
jgi:hypothetical protein